MYCPFSFTPFFLEGVKKKRKDANILNKVIDDSLGLSKEALLG